MRSSGGSDSNAGTSFGAAFATIQKAINTVAAGDLILVCADGTHLPTAQINWGSSVSGTASTPNVMRGASATGTDDGTVATISGASLPSSTSMFLCNASQTGWQFQNLIFQAPKSYFFEISNSGTPQIYFRNCTLKAASPVADFISSASGFFFFTFENCELGPNSGFNIVTTGSNRQPPSFYSCYIHDCATFMGGPSSGFSSVNCVFANMTNWCALNNSGQRFIVKNTFYNISGTVIGGSDRSPAGDGQNWVRDNIFHTCGICLSETDTGRTNYLVDYCLFYNNTTNASGGITLGSHCITGTDPLLNNPGSGDFGTKTGSPAWNAGSDGSMIGMTRAYNDIGVGRSTNAGGSGGIKRVHLDGGF